jgi:hypothetical protein
VPMILTGYLDESGTHDGSPVTVMGGVIARTDQWAAFDVKYGLVKKKYGFNVFHTKKFKSRSGDFAGWSDEKLSLLYWELATLTSTAFIEGVALSLDNAAYDAEYKSGEKPRRARLDSKYGLCFRDCLLFFVRQGLKRRLRKKYPKLYVVLESGRCRRGGGWN